MRIPRPRLTIRRLMVLILVAALIVGGVELRRRAGRYRRVAAFHEGEYLLIATSPVTGPYDESGADLGAARLGWHSRMAARYAAAAGRPWTILGPDPPEPPPVRLHRHRLSPRPSSGAASPEPLH